MTHNLILIDGNSIGNAVSATTKLTLGDVQVGAVYGYLKWLRKTLSAHPAGVYQPMVLWDGASWREMSFPDYKQNREKEAVKSYEIAQKEAKAAYRAQKPFIQKMLEFLGVTQVTAMNMEADDLAGILVQKMSGGRVRMFTDDKDWIQLVGPGVSWHNNKGRNITEANFTEETGAADPRAFVEVKALSGDTGDNIPGVGGVGEKGAIDFLNTYGSFNGFLNAVLLEKSVDLKKVPKKFRDLAEDEDKALIFERNIRLMDLRTIHRPEPAGLRFNRGTPSVEAFRLFCERFLFQSILDDFDNYVRAFPALAPQQQGVAA